MSNRSYKLAAIGCALTWFLVGMHWPLMHQIVSHGRAPTWWLLMIVLVLIALGLATLGALLRGPSRSEL